MSVIACLPHASVKMLRDDGDTVAFPEFAMRLSLILISLGLSACNRGGPPDPHHARKTEVTINLRPLGINRSETFEEVRAKALPQAVLDQMEGVADAGEPFNGTDVVDSGKPMTSFIVAAVSQHYCALSYWQGGIALTFNTKVFDLSDGHAGLIWHSQGQGGFYLEDLKEMIESGGCVTTFRKKGRVRAPHPDQQFLAARYENTPT